MGEWRKVETEAPEGASADHTAYEYQFGGEIDGVFVPAVTKAGGYVDAQIAAGKANQPEQPQTTDTPATDTAASGDTPPSGEGEAA